MSYYDEDQEKKENLTTPLKKIQEGIKELRDAYQARKENKISPWSLSHIIELRDALRQIEDVEETLEKLIKDRY